MYRTCMGALDCVFVKPMWGHLFKAPGDSEVCVELEFVMIVGVVVLSYVKHEWSVFTLYNLLSVDTSGLWFV